MHLSLLVPVLIENLMENKTKDEIEILKIKIELLLSLKYVNLFTGTPDKFIQKSYVLYSDITKLLTKFRIQLKKLEDGK
jgi:hypothetical protein